MFFSPKTNGKMILVLEIQSSIARSSLIWYRTGEQAQVIFVDERSVPYKTNVGTPYFVKTTLKALTQTIDAAAKSLHAISHEESNKGMPRHVEEVHYVLSSPWVASQARTLSLKFDKTTIISRDKVNEILEEERKKLTPESEGPVETIEEKIFDIRLNGYSVSEWEGKQAEQLDISYAVSVGGADTTKRFREACEHIVNIKKIHFHSSLLLQFVGIRTSMPERIEYTLVHIHGELTDVLAVKNGSCIFFGSFPMGVNTIVRKIAHSTGTDVQTADSLLSLYLGNRLDDAHTKQVTPIMVDMAAGWSGELRKLFRDAGLESGMNRNAIIAARTHDELFMKSFKSAYPDCRTETWSTSETIPDVTFSTAAHKMRGISIYAIALNVLGEQKS